MDSGDGGTPERVVGNLSLAASHALLARAVCVLHGGGVRAEYASRQLRKRAAQYEYRLPPPSFSEQTVKES